MALLAAQDAHKTALLATLHLKQGKRFTRRSPEVTPDPRESVWGRLLDHADVGDATTPKGVQFLRRFRMPHTAWLELVNEWKAHPDWYNETRVGRNGVVCIPVDILLACCIRYCAYGVSFDICSECSNVAESTLQSFFLKTFIPIMSGKFMSDKYIYLPRTEAELEHVLGQYKRAGLPGCFGSIDGVHVRLYCCPAGLYIVHKNGAKQHPTRSYQVIASHTCRIQYVSKGVPGSVNDMGAVRSDATIMGFNRSLPTFHGPTAKLVRDVTFTLRWPAEKGGGEEEHKGGYLITDGGYIAWECMISPEEVATDALSFAFRTLVESTRKDVERVFGMLKKKYQILNNGIRQHSVGDADGIMTACSVLYNIAHLHNGWDHPATMCDEDGVDFVAAPKTVRRGCNAVTVGIPAVTENVPDAQVALHRKRKVALMDDYGTRRNIKAFVARNPQLDGVNHF